MQIPFSILAEDEEKVPNEAFREVFGILADGESTMVKDSKKARTHSLDTINDIQDILLEENRSRIGTFETVEDVRGQSTKRFEAMTTDSFFNDVTGIGGGNDPAYYNNADIPVSLSPNDVTAIYASGGLGRIIIDLKANGCLMNGYQFKCDGLSKADLDKLHDHADGLNFDIVLTQAIRNGLGFGGSFMVPALVGDNAMTYSMTIPELAKRRLLGPNCIDRFWEVDRWNTVMIPSYDLTAADYLYPNELYIPVSGFGVSTQRGSIIRPKDLPYWGVIRQMGWGASDMEGWIRSVMAYMVAKATIPVMAQQASLMYRHIPIDGMVLQNGADVAKQFAREMAQDLNSWSSVQSKFFNQVGEIKTLERNYTGFVQMFEFLRADVGAQSEIAESILFHTQPTGFSDNEEDTTLKKAENIRTLGNFVSRQCTNIIKMLVYSTFGYGSEQAKCASTVRLCFDSPTVLTNKDRIENATAFAGLLTSLTGAGLALPDALRVGEAILPGTEFPAELMQNVGNEGALVGQQSPDINSGINAIMEKLRAGVPQEVGGGVADLTSKAQSDTANGINDLHTKMTVTPTPDHGAGVAELIQRLQPIGPGIADLVSPLPDPGAVQIGGLAPANKTAAMMEPTEVASAITGKTNGTASANSLGPAIKVPKTQDSIVARFRKLIGWPKK